MIKAIIFDMDGLLIDSEPVWFRAKEEFLGEYNVLWTWEDQRNSMGASTQAWVDYIYDLANKKLTKDEILFGVTDRMKLYYSNGEIGLMPGANEALDLAKKNYRVGLASGSYKDLIHRAVKRNNWEHIFDEILSGDDMERGKPSPDIYLEVMKRLNVQPSESVVLEDSTDGIKAGVAAGANVIAVPSKDVPVLQEVLDSAALVIDSLIELSDTLINLNADLPDN